MNLREEINRYRTLMGLKEQKTIHNLDLIELGGSMADIRRMRAGIPLGPEGDADAKDIEDYHNFTDDQKTPYEPNPDIDFSNSVIQDVVWRSGEIHNDPRSGGLWFAENKEDVENFAMSVRREKREGKPYYINLTNPYTFEEGFWRGYVTQAEARGLEEGRLILMREFMKKGFDGFIIAADTWNDTGDDYSVHSKQYVVFDRSQVKPADDGQNPGLYKKPQPLTPEEFDHYNDLFISDDPDERDKAYTDYEVIDNVVYKK